jgi:hypothetical protein
MITLIFSLALYPNGVYSLVKRKGNRAIKPTTTEGAMKYLDTGIVNGWRTFKVVDNGTIYTPCGVYVKAIVGNGLERRLTHNSEVSPKEVASQAESIYRSEKPELQSAE